MSQPSQGSINPHTVFVQCPSCNKVESSLLKAFCRDNLDRPIKCNHCAKKSMAFRWRCPCDMPWHTCPTHHSLQAGGRDAEHDRSKHYKGQSCSPSSTAQPKRKLLRRTSSEEYEFLLAEDSRRDGRKRAKLAQSSGGVKRKAIVLGDRPLIGKMPTRLGPILTSRFLGGGASSST